MPDQKTAPPTDKTEAHEAAERLLRGEADMDPGQRAMMQVAKANAAIATRGDWSLPARHQIDAAQMEVLRATVAKDCNQLELAMFLEVAARYGLDPFLKEIYAAKFDGNSGGVTVFTGRDGLLSAARRSARFVRIISAVVRESDHFEVVTRLGGAQELPPDDLSAGRATFGEGVMHLEHRRKGMGDSRGAIVGAYALVWKLGDPEPYYAEAPWSEHGAHRQKDGSNRDTTWTIGSRKGYPEQMMRKVAESIGLRMTFGIVGIVGAEELGDTPERVQNLSDPGGSAGRQVREMVVEYGDDELGGELRKLVEVANELLPGSWRPGKVAMRINGRPEDRLKLRDTLRRFIGQRNGGRERLDAIPVTKAPDPPEAEVVADGKPGVSRETPEPVQDAQEGAVGGSEGEVVPEGQVRPEDAQEGQDDGEVVDGVVEGTAEELPAYDQGEHSRLFDFVAELRGTLEGIRDGGEGAEPTLEDMEAEAEAERELREAEAALELMNRAAEAAGQPRMEP